MILNLLKNNNKNRIISDKNIFDDLRSHDWQSRGRRFESALLHKIVP